MANEDYREPAAERASFGEVVLMGRLREVILRDTLLPKLLSGGGERGIP
jgi:hypothetical protein